MLFKKGCFADTVSLCVSQRPGNIPIFSSPPRELPIRHHSPNPVPLLVGRLSRRGTVFLKKGFFADIVSLYVSQRPGNIPKFSSPPRELPTRHHSPNLVPLLVGRLMRRGQGWRNNIPALLFSTRSINNCFLKETNLTTTLPSALPPAIAPPLAPPRSLREQGGELAFLKKGSIRKLGFPLRRKIEIILRLI